MTSRSSTSSAGGGTSIVGLLGVAFVVLKLTRVIAWSWWWVTAPFWGGLALAAVLLIGAGIVLAVAYVARALSGGGK